MLRRNRELYFMALAYILLSAIALAAGFLHDRFTGVLVLSLCVCFFALFLGFSRWRYGKLRKLSNDLEALLHKGTLVPIQDYCEGELSILSSQIQKLTVRLLEHASAQEKDKRLLADFLADIAHQIRTPLTSMNLTVSMLAAPELTSARRTELTVELKNLLSRVHWLVESLLKLSRLDAGVVSFNRVCVTAEELIRRAAAPLMIAMELRELHFIADCAAACLSVDPVWTAEALSNILKNALEHTPAGGTIRIEAEETALYTQITVKDTGPGFYQEDIPHLFQRFYRGKGDTTNGHGIGLPLARTIIAAQNGTIRGANGPEGAEFTIRFYRQVI